MNVGQAAHLSGQMSGQTAQMNQVPGTGVGVGVGGADGLPQHQPMQEMAVLSGTDQQFVMLRSHMREKIFDYIGRKQSSALWRKRLPELAKRLEEILYRKFPNKNDYYNMMKGPVVLQLLFAIKTFIAQNQQNQQNPQVERQTPPSSSSNLTQAHDGQVTDEFMGYALSHKRKATDPANVYSPVDGPKAYTNANAYEDGRVHHGGSHAP